MFGTKEEAVAVAMALDERVGHHLEGADILPGPLGQGYGLLLTLLARSAETGEHQRCLVITEGHADDLVEYFLGMDMARREPIRPTV